MRATVGVSITMSRYSQNVPSQCCSRKRETSSFRSMIDTSELDLVAIGVFSSVLRSGAARRAHACIKNYLLAKEYALKAIDEGKKAKEDVAESE